MPKKLITAAPEFLWIPGQGSETGAISRMRMHFTQPPKPMGEAWFMGGERKMYNELFGDVEKLRVDYLQEIFVEIGSGTSSFGSLREWDDWLHFLLAHLMSRAHEQDLETLMEYMITAFMNIYPNGIENEPYQGFREDALNSLGKAIMDLECWEGENILQDKDIYNTKNSPAKLRGWDLVRGDFSSSMFFCLKYLNANQIPAWLNSVLAIKSPCWHAQVIVWLVGSEKILKGKIQQPAQFKGHPSVEWAWSHCIAGSVNHLERKNKQFPEFIAQENREIFLQTLGQAITEETYLEWLVSISQHEHLEAEIFGIPERFEEVYLRSR